GTFLGSVGASAYASFLTNSGNIGLSGPVLAQTRARSASDNDSNAVFADTYINIVVGSAGNVTVGNVTAKGTASATGSHSGQCAFASATIHIAAGESGGNVRTGFLDAEARANYAGTVDNSAFGNAAVFVSADSGSVSIFGAR